MKPFLYGALMLGLGALPAAAQQAATAPQALAEAKLQTDAAQVLTADFVRSSIYVGAGNLSERKGGDAVYLTLERETITRLKGADDTRFAGFLAPDAARASLGKKVLVFARFDGRAKRGVISAVLPATDANMARAKALVAANPTLDISVAASKTQFALGEPIVVKWTIKNVSGAPLSIYTGENATQINLNYGGSSHSFGDVAARKRPVFVRLQPGESWQYERVYDEEFPVGPIGIEYYYSASDALEVRGDAPDDLFLERASGELSVEVVPATAEQRARLLEQLESPVWTEQLAAAKLVAQSGDAADIEKLESFATHPDPRLREVAAQAMADKGVFTPELKRLFYQGVRFDLSALDRKDLTLAFLASNEINTEAQASGLLGGARGLVGDFYNLNDLRAGDLLATSLREKDRYGDQLAALVGLKSEVTNRAEPLAPALKARVLEAWQAKRATVKELWTPAQLQSEVDLARSIRYNNFEKGPFYEEVAAILDDGQKFGFNASAAMDAIDKRLLALPIEAVPTLFETMRWRGINSPPDGALQQLIDSDLSDKWVRLAQIAYARNDGDVRVAAIGLMADLDFERALPHLNAWLAQAPEESDWSLDAPRLGAALALAKRGEKRAIPVFFAAPYKRSLTFMRGTGTVEALQKLAGRDFKSLQAWSQWWDDEGSKMEWK